jgi:hypothetical protein
MLDDEGFDDEGFADTPMVSAAARHETLRHTVSVGVKRLFAA